MEFNKLTLGATFFDHEKRFSELLRFLVYHQFLYISRFSCSLDEWITEIPTVPANIHEFDVLNGFR